MSTLILWAHNECVSATRLKNDTTNSHRAHKQFSLFSVGLAIHKMHLLDVCSGFVEQLEFMLVHLKHASGNWPTCPES